MKGLWIYLYLAGYFITYPLVVRWTIRDFARMFRDLPWEVSDTVFSILWPAAASLFWPAAVLYLPYVAVRWVVVRTIHKFFIRIVEAESIKR